MLRSKVKERIKDKYTFLDICEMLDATDNINFDEFLDTYDINILDAIKETEDA